MSTHTNDNDRPQQPRLLVLGATGGTGRLIVSQALARGYDVSALVRSPEKAADLTGAKLIVGDARDESALRRALAGRDAVISALGNDVRYFLAVARGGSVRAAAQQLRVNHATVLRRIAQLERR